MTLQDLIQDIESIAGGQPSVQMIVENDVYKLNERADARYGVFAFTQETHSTSPDSDYITYNLILYYIDRLTDDERNEVEVQSTGVQVLGNILASLAERVVRVGDYNMQPFRQRFADVCAGVFARVAITTLKDTLCAEEFDGVTTKPVI
jgi:hypothetical protein